MSLKINLFPALNGDCILIKYGEQQECTILLDGGYGRACRRKLQDFVIAYKEQGKKIDIVIVTHIDSDHITGICELLSWEKFDSEMVKELWFNYEKKDYPTADVDDKENTRISWKQGKALKELVWKHKIQGPTKIVAGQNYQIGEAEIFVLNPDEEVLERFEEKCEEFSEEETKIAAYHDYEKPLEELAHNPFDGKVSLTNQSSIAFLMKYAGSNMLFLGDAPSDKIVRELRRLGYSKEHPLELVCCKIAHHASKHNTSDELLDMIKCHNYLISTNLTSSGRPSKECLSRIVLHATAPIRFYCNYDMRGKGIFSECEIETYGIEWITQEEINLEELINVSKPL